jgi:putative addiction module component (TIGR02574 family)
MTNLAEDIFAQALALSPLDRAALVEKLLVSLDQPDSAIDKLWAKEAEDRIDAYEAGEMEAISAEEVFKKYEKL